VIGWPSISDVAVSYNESRASVGIGDELLVNGVVSDEGAVLYE
jgi:hypothetical protein